MRRVRKKWTVIASGLALAGWLTWQFGPVQAIQAIASLSDPAKLSTLGERGANSRLNKLVYWIDQSQHKGLPAGAAITLAQRLNGTPHARAELVKASLLRNYKIAAELGLFAGDNAERLRRGRAAIVTRGPYAGEAVEIDHIVPYSLAPEAGNELGNLEMLPRTLNRKKSNRVGDRQLAHAQALYAAGLLTEASLARLKAHASLTNPKALAQ